MTHSSGFLSSDPGIVGLLCQGFRQTTYPCFTQILQKMLLVYPTGMQSELMSCMTISTLDISKGAHSQSKCKWNLCTSISHLSHYLSQCSHFRAEHSHAYESHCLLKDRFLGPPPEFVIQQFWGEAQHSFSITAMAAGPGPLLEQQGPRQDSGTQNDILSPSSQPPEYHSYRPQHWNSYFLGFCSIS